MTPTPPAAAALKPCPFCPDGGKPKVESHNVAHGVSDDNCVDGWIVICEASNGGCGAGTGWQESGAEATAAWNRRSPGAEPPQGASPAPLADEMLREARAAVVSLIGIAEILAAEGWEFKGPDTEERLKALLAKLDAALAASPERPAQDGQPVAWPTLGDIMAFIVAHRRGCEGEAERALAANGGVPTAYAERKARDAQTLERLIDLLQLEFSGPPTGLPLIAHPAPAAPSSDSQTLPALRDDLGSPRSSGCTGIAGIYWSKNP